SDRALQYAGQPVNAHMQGMTDEMFTELKEFFTGTGVQLTIHNIAYQGLFPLKLVSRHSDRVKAFTDEIFRKIGLPWTYFAPQSQVGGEFFGQLNFLLWGMQSSDVVNTVSENYAVELSGEDQLREMLAPV